MTQVPPFMGDLSDDDIAWLYRNGTLRHVSAGEAIIKEGEDPSEVFFILAGEFVVSTTSYTLPLERSMGPGEITGEMSYVNKQPAGATVRARVDSVVLCVSRAKLDRKMATDEKFASRFRKMLLEFAMDRIYGWREPHGDAHLPNTQGPNASLRVWILIKKMLEGEFPDSLPPEPDPGSGRPPRKPGGRPPSGGSGGPPKGRGRSRSKPDPDEPDGPPERDDPKDPDDPDDPEKR